MALRNSRCDLKLTGSRNAGACKSGLWVCAASPAHRRRPPFLGPCASLRTIRAASWGCGQLINATVQRISTPVDNYVTIGGTDYRPTTAAWVGQNSIHLAGATIALLGQAVSDSSFVPVGATVSTVTGVTVAFSKNFTAAVYPIAPTSRPRRPSPGLHRPSRRRSNSSTLAPRQ